MKTKRFYRRRFLNRPRYHSGAYVLADCQMENFGTKGERSYAIEANLTIGDCGRTVSLDFFGSDRRAVENSLHKARLLRDTVVDFTTALEAATDEWRELQNPGSQS